MGWKRVCCVASVAVAAALGVGCSGDETSSDGAIRPSTSIADATALDGVAFDVRRDPG